MGDIDEQLDRLDRRARRRWLVTMALALVVILGGNALWSELTGHDRHHHHGVWAVVVPVGEVLAVCAVLLLVLAVRSRRRPAMYGSPYNGLGSAGQRAVDRAIAQATPSENGLSTQVEAATARQRLRDSRPMYVIYGLVLIACIGAAISADHLRAHLLYGVGALIMVIALVQQRRAEVASRRYLRAARSRD